MFGDGCGQLLYTAFGEVGCDGHQEHRWWTLQYQIRLTSPGRGRRATEPPYRVRRGELMNGLGPGPGPDAVISAMPSGAWMRSAEVDYVDGKRRLWLFTIISRLDYTFPSFHLSSSLLIFISNHTHYCCAHCHCPRASNSAIRFCKHLFASNLLFTRPGTLFFSHSSRALALAQPSTCQLN